MPEGEKTDSLGLVMSGSVLIVQDDFWGNRNIMARITQGGIFAESFACTGEKLTVGAEAESECEIMRLKVGHVLKSCPKSCSAHSALVGNLIHELARKNLNFNSKLGHMGKRTTREKLMSYLSAQAMKSGKMNLTFRSTASSLPTICALTAVQCPPSSAHSGTTEY